MNGKKFYILDVMLCDGMYVICYQYFLVQVQQIVGVLDKVGVDFIEVVYGDGLQGFSFNYGFGVYSDIVWIEVVVDVVSQVKIVILLLLGIGMLYDLKVVYQVGVWVVWVVIYCSEVDVVV